MDVWLVVHGQITINHVGWGIFVYGRVVTTASFFDFLRQEGSWLGIQPYGTVLSPSFYILDFASPLCTLDSPSISPRWLVVSRAP